MPYCAGLPSRAGGTDRTSTKSKLAAELVILGKLLSRERESRKLRQLVVAERLGLPASYLSKIESGTRRLDVIEFIRIAEAMGADPAQLMRELQRMLRSETEG